MRKLVIATTLTVVLAGTASASDIRFQDRGPRDRDTPIVRVYKAIKRLLTPSTTTGPTVPIPKE
jgi:hypothetical protein